MEKVVSRGWVSERIRSAVWFGSKFSRDNGGMGCKRAEEDGPRKNGNAQGWAGEVIKRVQATPGLLSPTRQLSPRGPMIVTWPHYGGICRTSDPMAACCTS